MKKLTFLLLVISTFLYGQKPDTLKLASADSVDIQAMVLKQIEDARQKHLSQEINNYQISNESTIETRQTEDKLAAPVEVEKVKTPKQTAAIYQPLLNMPLHYQIFFSLSLVIILFVTVKRTVSGFSKRSTRILKKKIGMLREEKIGGSKVEPKTQRARKILKDNLDVLKQTDKQISKRAKQMNLSKGELLLAARLKLLEVGKL